MHDPIRALMFARWFEKKAEAQNQGTFEKGMYTMMNELLTAFHDPEATKRFLFEQAKRLLASKQWTPAQKHVAENIFAELPGEEEPAEEIQSFAVTKLKFVKEDYMKYALSIYQKNNPTVKMMKPLVYRPGDAILIRFAEETVSIEYSDKWENDDV